MIFSSVLFLFGLGLGAAVLLALAATFLAVKEDPRVEKVESALPGANCGGCGFPGCAAAAAAMVSGKADPDACVVGGENTARAIAGILGLEILLKETQVSFHDCSGGPRAILKYAYEGVKDCRAQALLYDGAPKCGHGCLGLGSCVRECPFDALSIGPEGVPCIDASKCRACGRCERICPRGVISMVTLSSRLLHLNLENDCLAPCRQICPAQIDIPEYIDNIRHRRFEDAIRTLKERNPLILTCGRVCPAPCEGYCRRALVDDPVGINYLKRFVADWEYNRGERVSLAVLPDTGKRIAVVGGGPAGLTCAYFLRRLGHQPVIFDSKPALGGQLRYGIPEYRLPKRILDWEIEGILSLGIEVRTNTLFGRDITLSTLEENGFQAVFLGLGAWLSHTLGIEGEDAGGVIGGTEYLTTVGLGQDMQVGRHVVVIGGGNTAIDAARTSRRLGARVTVMYRRTRDAMPANPLEIKAAEEEGIGFLFMAAPTRVLTDTDGNTRALEYSAMEPGPPDASGRRRPVPVAGSESELACDTIIAAIGQYPDTCYIEEHESACGLDRRKTILVREHTMQTALPHVFAGGDVVSGPSLVVTAIGAGRKAARAIHSFLTTGEVTLPPGLQTTPLPETLFTEISGIAPVARVKPPELCVEERACNFREVEQGIPPSEAEIESARCLRCGSTCYSRTAAEAEAGLGSGWSVIPSSRSA